MKCRLCTQPYSLRIINPYLTADDQYIGYLIGACLQALLRHPPAEIIALERGQNLLQTFSILLLLIT